MTTGTSISALTAAATITGDELLHVVQSGNSRKATASGLVSGIGLLKTSNLSDLPSAATARTNLGLQIGNDVQAHSADLQAISALSSTGLIARTASGSAAARTLTGTSNEITVSNGDGVSGNPTVSLPTALTFTGKTVTGGTYTGATIENTPIGGSTAAAGAFTTVGGTTITASTSFRGVDFGSGNTSDVNVTTSGGNQFRVKHRASAVNVFAAQGSASGNDVFLFTEGSDTNIDIAYILKGAAQMLTYNAAGGTLLTTLNSAGDFLPGTTESQDLGSASLEWDNLFVQNAVTVSDARFKTAIEDIPYGLDFINALRPRIYKYADKTVQTRGVDADGNETTTDKDISYSRKHAGLIAQEVKSAMDDLKISTGDFAGFVDANVNGGPDRLMLRYLEFIPPLIKAVQEVSVRVEALEAT